LPQKLLLVLPLRLYHYESKFFIDAQAHNGLRLWLDNFDSLILACPQFDAAPPTGYLPVDDRRITFVGLPEAYTPHRFMIALYGTAPKLRQIIETADHLHFAIGGMFGDWASACAIIARRSGKHFSIWTDRVESQVALFQAKSKTGPKRLYYMFMAFLMKIYERQIIKLSSLGLFHGMDCYTAYSPYSSNPQLVHDIHLGTENQITDLDIEARLKYSGRVRIAYAGRVHREKGVFDWIDALSLASKSGLDFHAVWFGDGPDLKGAVKRVKDEKLSERVHFMGAVKHRDLIEHLRSFDLFMFCHKTMESPRCLIEALICGLPLIGYASPYSQDLIKEHGGGILSQRDRPDLLLESISYFMQNRRELTKSAQQDGRRFDAETAFRHRSDLMKSMTSEFVPRRTSTLG
jgi:colanic acid/amylovoran biosynthesis glycosyltransferase